MEIQHETTETKGVFFIEKDGKRIAEMTYSKAGETKIIIDHTEVSDEGRGKGYGKQLVQHGVEFARENDLKIVPLCPFANAIIQKTPQFQDVL
ncbi:MAG: N-acetyltransferase [Gracilimonas sp.]|uniref:GNAT family N-acetyltransferase n=1 Tax=Gracilimonas sp. TaxID=1974203 RepID=UPI0019A60FA5|nr:GNAT family N-acetyltransferase [Gracilimonas sp.]MBD3615544.1 N-acetyltransferase [Gracilimonas sp.]